MSYIKKKGKKVNYKALWKFVEVKLGNMWILGLIWTLMELMRRK